MQIAEVEILGIKDTTIPAGFPSFTIQPVSMATLNGGSASFNAAATGTPTPTYQWLVGTNGVYTKLTVPGADSQILSLNAVTFANTADYVCAAANTYGSVTSSVARLTVLSPLQDVTSPSDVITAFGDMAGTHWNGSALAANAIDNTGVTYITGGNSDNGAAGFPPFLGPVGFVVTPALGSTLVTGLRVYTANGNPERDPTNYVFEGSMDGTTFYAISSGALNLPTARNDTSVGIDPTSCALQEILFPNTVSYTSYRLTFINTRDDSVAIAMQIADFELLGVAASPTPVLKVTVGANGVLTLTTTTNGKLQSTTVLNGASTVWTDVGSVTGSTTITPLPTDKAKFFRIVTP